MIVVEGKVEWVGDEQKRLCVGEASIVHILGSLEGKTVKVKVEVK